MSDNTYIFIGSELRKIRESKNVSRKEITEKLYISEETIRRIEKGNNEPRISTLIPICIYLDIEIKDLFKSDNTQRYSTFNNIRRELNYLINNKLIKEAKQLLDNLDYFYEDDKMFCEQELLATKLYYDGVIKLEGKEYTNKQAVDQFERALSILYPKFKSTDFNNYRYSNLSLRILQALALSKFKIGDNDLYKSIILEISRQLNEKYEDYFIYCYNIGLLYFRTKDYDNALKICDKTILKAKKLNTLYYLNIIYYLKGLSHYRRFEQEKAKLSFKYCLMLSNIISDHKLINEIEGNVNKILA